MVADREKLQVIRQKRAVQLPNLQGKAAKGLLVRWILTCHTL